MFQGTASFTPFVTVAATKNNLISFNLPDNLNAAADHRTPAAFAM